MRHITMLLLAGWVLANTALGAGDGSSDQRAAFDLRWTQAADWELGKTLQLSVADGRLEVTNRGGEPGWAATVTRWMLDADATLALHVAQVSSAQLTVQAEWLTETGAFLGAATAVDRANESDTRVTVKLAELMPKASPDTPQPAMMRLKLWVGGDGGRVVIDDLRITAPRRWRDVKTRSIAVIAPTSPLAPDAGLIAGVDGDAIAMTLESGRGFAGLVVGQPVALHAKAAAMLDVSWLARGRVGLQAVCFGEGGRHLGAVDLLKEIERPGLYEVPLSIYRSAFPAGTKSIQFKLWLGGGGASARVAGIWVGELP